MRLTIILVLYNVLASVYLFMEINQASKNMLFDFRSAQSFNQKDAEAWTEISDTVRKPGMSKAIFTLQKTQLFQRAILFAIINPQPNGAAFAGVHTNMPRSRNLTFPESEDNSHAKGLKIFVKGQGQLKFWKVVLKDDVNIMSYDFEQKFEIKNDDHNHQFEAIYLPFCDFKAYFRGKEVPDAPDLNLKNIETFGLQTFGGIYDDFKQCGTGSLEIDYVTYYYASRL